jgi:peroxin-19
MESKPGDLEGLAEASGKAMEKGTTAVPIPKDPASTETPKPNAPVPTKDVPDPEEDDLDDLDGQPS